MAGNCNVEINFEGKRYLAIILTSLKRNGMHYEVNIKGFPRFFMKWSAADRYDIVHNDKMVPDALILAVSDAIEKRME